jgi:hypothetical protein
MSGSASGSRGRNPCRYNINVYFMLYTYMKYVKRHDVAIICKYAIMFIKVHMCIFIYMYMMCINETFVHIYIYIHTAGDNLYNGSSTLERPDKYKSSPYLALQVNL